MPMNSEMSEARQRIASAYDPELLRGAGHRLIDQLAAHLRDVQACRGAVLPWRDPAANVAEAASWLERSLPAGAERERVLQHFSELVALMLQRGHNLHDPRYIGHQVPASVPLAGLFDAVGSVTNQPMAIYDMGPWATAAEWCLVDRLGPAHRLEAGRVRRPGHARRFAGQPDGTVGRPQRVAAGLVGARARGPPVIARAGRACGHALLGRSFRRRSWDWELRRCCAWGSMRGAAWIRTGSRILLRELRQQNRPVVAVVACACSTPIGAFDPLRDIADVCRRHGVWLHVDAAHGGSACVSPRYRHLVAGLDRADSVVWDAHKMLFMPALCAFVFFRDKAHRFEAFRQEAPYLFDPDGAGTGRVRQRTAHGGVHQAGGGVWVVGRLGAVWPAAVRRPGRCDVLAWDSCSTKSCWRHPTSNRCTNRNAISSCSVTCPLNWPTRRANNWAASSSSCADA